jgi:hypothetical protein
MQTVEAIRKVIRICWELLYRPVDKKHRGIRNTH